MAETKPTRNSESFSGRITVILEAATLQSKHILEGRALPRIVHTTSIIDEIISEDVMLTRIRTGDPHLSNPEQISVNIHMA